MNKESTILELSQNLVNILKEKKLKITFAESCTGGLMSASLVDIPGASQVFEFGFITYSATSKQEMIGVKSETIKEYGIVSREVAEEMVIGAVSKSKASVGISVTGSAGPGKDSEGNEAGTVCFGFYISGKVTTKIKKFEYVSRSDVRKNAVEFAFDFIYKEISAE